MVRRFSLTMPSRHWSEQEVRETISSYLAMLGAFHRGERFTKAEVVRQLQKRVDGRTGPAVEKKFQNISAVLIEIGLDYLDGYVPLFNYQKKLLPGLVVEALAKRADVVELLRREAEREPRAEAAKLRQIVIEQPPKKFAAKPGGTTTPGSHVLPSLSVGDLAGRQQRNAALGLAGEEAILEFERRRLHNAGHKDLSRRVEHVSQTRGDGLGYDIASFEESGSERLIEVKTTQWGALTQFFVSPNEVAVSQVRVREYCLYRLYRFEVEPRLYVLRGALDASCRLEVSVYRARIA